MDDCQRFDECRLDERCPEYASCRAIEASKEPQQLNMDELIAQMQLDELADAPLITPVDYSKLHQGRIAPQLVYYHIKANHIPEYRCPCGRRCVKRAEADKFFRQIGRLPELCKGEEQE